MGAVPAARGGTHASGPVHEDAAAVRERVADEGERERQHLSQGRVLNVQELELTVREVLQDRALARGPAQAAWYDERQLKVVHPARVAPPASTYAGEAVRDGCRHVQHVRDPGSVQARAVACGVLGSDVKARQDLQRKARPTSSKPGPHGSPPHAASVRRGRARRTRGKGRRRAWHGVLSSLVSTTKNMPTLSKRSSAAAASASMSLAAVRASVRCGALRRATTWSRTRQRSTVPSVMAPAGGGGRVRGVRRRR